MRSSWSLLRAEQPQLSWSFLIGEVHQPTHHLCEPGHAPYVLHVLRSSDLEAVLQVGFHKGRVEVENHLPQPSSHSSFDAGQYLVDLQGCKNTLWLTSSFSFIRTLNTLLPVCTHVWVVLSHVQDLALGLVESLALKTV